MLALFSLRPALSCSAGSAMSGGAEAEGLLDSLGVSAVDASAVEKDLWAQVGLLLVLPFIQYCELL